MDFNGDFHPDLLVVGANGTAVVFLGDGKGNFVNGGSFATGGNNVASVAAADYNRDGNFDVAFAGYSDSQVRVFQGLGNGKFDVNNPKIINVGNHPLSLINIYRVRNGAVASDLAIANNGSGTISVIASSCSQ